MVTKTTEPLGKTLSLKVLAAAITKIESIRDLEHSCEVQGVQITLRPLQPEQEVEVQEYVAPAWRESRDEQANMADFMDRLRLATLSHALMQIGDVDLRGVEYLQTDEVDENGNSIVLPKQDALRQMLALEWTRPMLSQVFSQYGKLLDKLEARASSAVAYDPVDLDTEIERLERRLVDLRDAKEKADKPSSDVVQQRQRAVLDAQSPPRPTPKRDPAADTSVLADEALAQDERKPSGPAPAPAAPSPSSPPPSVAQASPPTSRRSAVPEAAHAPAAPPREPEKVELAIDAEMSPAHAASAELEFDERGQTMPLGGDSFFDPSDPDAALAMETRRQAQLIREGRQRSQEQTARSAEQAARRAEMGLPDAREITRATAARTSGVPRAAASLDPVTGSLRAAANTSNAVLDAGAGAVRSGRPAVRPTGGAPGVPAQLHGKPVYQTPTQVLDRSVRSDPSAPPSAPVNPAGGSHNPKFRPPGST